jgi:hypothetical protein
MTARKPKDQHKPNGRPSGYTTQHAERAYTLAQGGATDLEIADALKIGNKTFYRWRNEHPEFRQATAMGKEAADERVERSLYQRALGYSHPAVKIFMPANAEAPVYAEYIEHYPPDTAAASLWLRNRKSQEWRDKVDHELTGKDGAPLVPVINVTVGGTKPPST